MQGLLRQIQIASLSIALFIVASCEEKNKSLVASESIDAMKLKRGEIIACGPADKEFGSVGFETTCTGDTKKDFDLGLALLHSFEYDEAEKVFAKVIDNEPACAMAYWGVAMSNYHQLWAPPTPAELEKGAKAIAIAQSLPKSAKEAAYIDAIALFFKDWNKTDHRSRSLNFEKAMEKIYTDNKDKESATFYALALTSTADLSDKTYVNQRKAGKILESVFPNQPDHPGIIHYIIHAYDYPELASMALTAARKYASIAPSSAHAQHMPSHIFTRLGLWEENIRSNAAAAASAKCYGENMGIEGHWDEELHAIDYLVYAYLQQGDNTSAKQQLDYLRTITEVSPTNFKVAYAFAASPSRFVLENKLWKEAAELSLHPANLAWEKYPWQKAIHHFARLLGAANSNNLAQAKSELKTLQALHDALVKEKDAYKANQVQIQIKSSEAWIAFKEDRKEEALQLMTVAAEMEDHTEKHSVTPGEVIPARELLGDMLLQMNQPAKALVAYEADLKAHANRFNGLYGAAVAAQRSNDLVKAKKYYEALVSISSNSSRSELNAARAFLKK